MRVLVTGGTGFIGANLVRMLLERGISVRALVRSERPSLALDGLPLERFVGSLTDPTSMQAALEDVTQVYHLAGAYETGPGAAERMWDCHNQGTRTLGEAALAAGIERMVVCSSSITLPYGPLDAPAKETDPDPYATVDPPYAGELLAYYRAKRAQEAVALELNQRGLPTVIVNPDFVLGPWDIKPSSGAILLQVARLPWLPVYPPGGKSFIHVRDCAEGHILAMKKGIPGSRYLLGDHNLTYGEALRVMAQGVGRPRPGLKLPLQLLGLAGVAEKWCAPLLPEGNALTARLGATFIGRYRSPLLARTELGLGSTPFEVMVDDAWRWFRAHGYG